MLVIHDTRFLANNVKIAIQSMLSMQLEKIPISRFPVPQQKVACRGAFVRRIPALWQMFEHNPLILLRKIAKKENEMTDAALISNESRAHQVQSQKYPQITKEINTTKEVIAYALQSSLHF